MFLHTHTHTHSKCQQADSTGFKAHTPEGSVAILTLHPNWIPALAYDGPEAFHSFPFGYEVKEGYNILKNNHNHI